MKTIKFLAIAILCWPWSICTFGAVTVSLIFNENSGYFVKPDGVTNLNATGVLSYGVLDVDAFELLTTEQQNQMSEVSALFTSYNSRNFDSSGYLTILDIDESGGTQGDQLSVFVSQGSDFGVFSSTNTLWDYPADNAAATLTSALIDVSYVGSRLTGTPNTFQLVTSVPEPSKYALVFSAIILIYARRRRAAKS